jgi:hypothetical protein
MRQLSADQGLHVHVLVAGGASNHESTQPLPLIDPTLWYRHHFPESRGFLVYLAARLASNRLRCKCFWKAAVAYPEPVAI